MKTYSLILLGFGILTLVGCEKQTPGPTPPPSSSGEISTESNPAAEKAAIASAQAWLKLADSGNFASCWKETSSMFRGMVSQEDWERMLKTYRSTLGKVSSRNLKSQKYATSLPGAPDGEYVVIQFESSFENKAKAVETVSSMMDKDGQWRVSGYFIK